MPGQLVSAILVDIKDLDNPRVFNYQKTQINFIALSCDGEFICSVGSSSEGAYSSIYIANSLASSKLITNHKLERESSTRKSSPKRMGK